jgi:uncharacterized protein (TIGR02145 family)
MKKTKNPSLSLAALGLAGFTFLAACSGQDGINGTNGADGVGCTVVEAPAGTYTMYCGASSSSVATWSDGKDGVNGVDGKDGVCPSCAANASSSSVASACPAYEATTHFCDERDGKVYKYVAIGAQTWMAENLNYDPYPSNALGIQDGSWCYGTTLEATTTENVANCAIYGRLYGWITAMSLAEACATASCSEQIGAKHQGVCPSGWHIPTNDEWDILLKYVDAQHEGLAADPADPSWPYQSSWASKYLKATSGWEDDAGNGEDTYGFSALPGGEHASNGEEGTFSHAGAAGYWWSASESDAENAYYQGMGGYGNEVTWGSGFKNAHSAFSVRCVKD